jgi:hypothetical protein
MVTPIGRLSQAVDEFAARSRGKAVHARRRVARIAEILDDGEGKAMSLGQPFEPRPDGACHGLRQNRLGLALGFRLDVAGE